MSATLTLFPLLGRTPPPWRWQPDVLATSFGTHVAYVAGGRRRGRRHPSPGRCVMSGTRMVSERDVGFVGPGGSARAVFTLAIDDL